MGPGDIDLGVRLGFKGLRGLGYRHSNPGEPHTQLLNTECPRNRLVF